VPAIKLTEPLDYFPLNRRIDLGHGAVVSILGAAAISRPDRRIAKAHRPETRSSPRGCTNRCKDETEGRPDAASAFARCLCLRSTHCGY
jgi:hypothetical protein